MNRDSLWQIVVQYGMRPNSQVAIDDTWSALRFHPDREGDTPFTGGQKRVPNERAGRPSHSDAPRGLS